MENNFDKCFNKYLQMFVIVFFTTGWRWHSKDETYRKILDMFMDKKSSYYSIHQIGK